MDKNIIDKMKFLKSFWEDILKNGIYIYSGYYFTDLITILDDVIRILNNYKGEKYELREIRFLFLELKDYFKNNIFYKCTYKNEVHKLEFISKNINKYLNNNLEKFTLNKNELEKNIKSLYKKVNSKDNINLIANSIKKEVYSNEPLDSCKYKLQSLTIDYIFCLLRSNFSLEYLKKEIFDIDYSEMLKDPEEMWYYPKNEVTRPIREFDSFINRANNRNEDEITYIFKIKGLKITMPFKIESIYFYNPLRPDLLEWKYNLEINDSEIFFLSNKEREVFEGIKRGKEDLLSKNYSEVEYTDCHVRICVKASSIDEGMQEAKNKLSDIIDTIKYVYSFKNIFIDDGYYVESNNFDKSRLSIPNKNRGSKFYDIDYSPSFFTDYIQRDLEDTNSKLQKFLKISNSEVNEKFKKASHWYMKGNESEIEYEKFLNYWISIEFMSNLNNGNSIKKNIIHVGTSVLVLTSFMKELIYLHRYVANEICKHKNPNEKLKLALKQIDGMENIDSKVNIKVFANSLKIIYKYVDDEYIKHKIMGFINAYSDVKFQKKYIERLNKNYKNILGRLYRIRNLIVHNADLDDKRLSLYTNYLKILCERLLHNIMIEEEQIISEWNYDYIDKLYSQWLANIKNSKIIDIV